MEIESIKSELKQLIAKGQNEKALQRLLELTKVQPAAISDQIISLCSSYKKLKDDISYGTLSDDSEKQFSNELTRRLISIVNSLVRIRTPEEMEAERIELERQKKEKEKGPEEREKEEKQKIKKSYSGVFLIVAVLLTSILVYDAVSSGNKTGSGKYNVKSWIGEWEQEIEAAGGQMNTGTLEFKKNDKGELEGTSNMIYGNGVASKLELSNIVFNGETGTLKGHWKMLDDESKPGDFEFALENENTFKGFFSEFSNSKKRHYWNGKKKKVPPK